MGVPAVSAAVLHLWRSCRDLARAEELSHSQAFELVQAAAAAGQWSRLRRWLPPLLRHGVNPGERQGSAIALAAWLREQRRLLEAMVCLEPVDWRHCDADAWLLRGVIEHGLGRTTEAQLSLARALALPQLQANAAYHLGELHRSLGQFDQAAGWFLASLAADPGHRFSHNSLQFTDFSRSLLPRLIADYEQIVARQPNQPLPHYLLAHYQLQAGQTDAAMARSRIASRLGLGERASLLLPAGSEAPFPEFVIAGTAKAGTTALLGCLALHPQLWCHPRKELHFFDTFHGLGEAWYRAQFPAFDAAAGIRRGEATPSYFGHPAAPERLAALMPQARVIVLFRDPIARAISWVQHLQRLVGLRHEVETVLRQELTRLEALTPQELALLEPLGSGALQHSCYDQALARWRQHLGEQQLLLINSERLFGDPEPELARVLAFLEVEPAALQSVLQAWKPLNVNPAATAEISPELRQDLSQFFKRHNQGLQALRH